MFIFQSEKFNFAHLSSIKVDINIPIPEPPFVNHDRDGDGHSDGHSVSNYIIIHLVNLNFYIL